MQSQDRPKAIVAMLAAFLLIAPVLVTFLAQEPQPSPSPSPVASPTGSPSPSPSPRAPTPTPLPGAQNFHQWGSVTVFNGLPSDSVRAIAQTSDGVMWFGTDNGLARFDGRRVQNFTPGDETSRQVLALESAGGDLWIGTRSGAFVYGGRDFQAVVGTEGMGITTIHLGSANYLGTDNGQVFRVLKTEAGTPFAEKVFPNPLPPLDDASIAITSMIEAGGLLLVATSGRGVYSVKDGNVNVVHTPPSPGVINSLAVFQDMLWMGAEAARNVSGVYRSTGGPRFDRIAAPTATVFALESNDGGVWAGTERFGLFHFTASKLKKNYTFENTSGGLRSNTVYTLFTDREGVVWIGTNRGVSRFDRLGASQENVSAIPNSNFIRSLYLTADKQTLYAGSNRGLFRKNGENWDKVAAIGDRVVYAVNALNENNSEVIIAGTPDGLYDIGGRKIIDGDVRSIDIFKGRMFAAIYGRGVFEISNRSQRAVLQNGSVTSVTAHGDKLWIGTNGNGLHSYDGSTTKLESANDVLKSGTIWGMYGAGNDLWIAGQHGVFVTRNGTSEQIVAVEDVRDIWVDGKDFWAATTTRGLMHGRNDDRFGWLVTAIGFEQGLPSEKAFAILPSNDGLTIGTNRGVVSMDSGSVSPKLIAVRLLSQRTHDLSELASKIALDYPQNSLLVEVAGQSSRTFPEEFQYSYVLRNAKGDLVDARLSNDAQYAPANLSPGDYTIEAIAFNRDLLASEPLAINFSVAKAPFPWTATALGVLLLLSLVGLVWAIVEHRRIAERNRELAAARLDLANEAERERRRIARDLHDQTLADLRNLMITTDKMEGDHRAFRSEIEAVSTEIRRICEDLSPSVLENVGLVAALEFLLDRTVGKRQFNADAGVEERITFPLNVQLQIYRIAQEVLTNIDRHSDADLVEMNVEAPEPGEFALTIRDNGRVFLADSAEKKGRGIANIRSRANLINARVSWKESREGGGNVFSLMIGEV